MTLGLRFFRLLLVGSLAAGGLVASSSPAPAAFHLMKVVEVFSGTTTDANADFVELQMYSAGQNFVRGHVLHLYGAPSYPGEPSPRLDCSIPSNVANGADQATILFSTSQAQSAFGTADFTMPPFLSGAGGAVCFENIDCVSWGSFSGTTTHPAGTPEPGGIPPDQSIHRSIAGGNPALLESSDDTDDSATDFSPGPESAKANGPTNLGTMSCQVGGPGGGGGGAGSYEVQGLKARVRGSRAVISGKVEPPAPGKKVAITFYANGSPLKKVAKKSSTLNSESRFKKGFRVPSGATRCKARVRFQGARLGQKTFRC
jgi:hypothetical protein